MGFVRIKDENIVGNILVSTDVKQKSDAVGRSEAVSLSIEYIKLRPQAEARLWA